MQADRDQATRDLRLRIGRMRRRIDCRISAVDREARRLASWRTYVTHYPAGALLVAFGAGLTLSAGLSPRGLSRWLALRLVRQGWERILQGVAGEIRHVWDRSMPSRPLSV